MAPYKPRKSKGKKTASLSKKVDRLERKVKEAKPEMKYINNSASTVATLTAASPQVILLNGMAQGINENSERIGAKTCFKFFNIRIKFLADISTQTASSFFNYRMLIVRERTTLGSDLGLVQLFGTATPTTTSQRSLVTRDQKRFDIYHDTCFDLGNFAGGKASKTIILNKRFCFTTDYTRNTGATITAIETNGFFLVMICDQTIASAVDITYEYTMGFTDV